jgi:hypothetical protein
MDMMIALVRDGWVELFKRSLDDYKEIAKNVLSKVDVYKNDIPPHIKKGILRYIEENSLDYMGYIEIPILPFSIKMTEDTISTGPIWRL